MSSDFVIRLGLCQLQLLKGDITKIAVDAIEPEPQFLHRPRLEMVEWRHVERPDFGREFLRGDDFDWCFSFGEEIQHGFSFLG